MEKLNKKTKAILFSGIIYSFIITLIALAFMTSELSLHLAAAKELIFKASEILSFAIIFSAFVEIFIQRFKG